MKSVLILGLLAFGASAPATAATLLFAEGDSRVITFNGLWDPSGSITVAPGLGAKLILKLSDVSANGRLATFDYTMQNISAAPATSSRVTSFGFDVDTAGFNFISSSVGAGVFDGKNAGNFPVGFGSVDFCATARNSCAGGGGGGVAFGGTGNGSFQLAFNAAVNTVELSRFVVRYQSVDSPPIRGGSAIGVPTDTPPIPEPATWAMLILGFGLVGVAVRRERRLQAA